MPTTTRHCGGFTLIELLVVVLIIGVLAAIAIPTLLGQREQAREAAVQSDLRNAAYIIITHAERNDGELPATWDDIVDAGHRPSTNLTPEDGADITWDPDAGCLSIAHPQDQVPYRFTRDSPNKVETGTC